MRFELVRDEDETGVSGEGVVAQGVVWDDGTVTMRWLTKLRTTTNYDCLFDVFAIHGHGGKTRIVPEKGVVICSRVQRGHELLWFYKSDRDWGWDEVTISAHEAHHGTRFVRHRPDHSFEEQLRLSDMHIRQAVFETGGSMFSSHPDVNPI